MDASLLKWIKVGVVVAVVGILVALFFVVKYEKDAAEKQTAVQNSLIEMKQLPDGTVRSSAEYISKEDFDKFIQDHNIKLEEITKDLSALHAQLAAINIVTIQTPGYQGNGLPSTGTTPRGPSTNPQEPLPTPSNDPFGYLANAQVLGLVEPFGPSLGVPWGQATFKAWQAKPWDLTVYPRQYKVVTTISTREDGQKVVHNQAEIITQGKTYEVPISQSETVEKYPESQFFINPRVYLGVGTGVSTNPVPGFEFIPFLSASFFSYGKTKKIEDTSWSFGGIGIGYETQGGLPVLVVSPVDYNIGKEIPYIDNLHVGPAVSVDWLGRFSIMAEIKVGL